MRTISIGDPHGRDAWKNHTHGSVRAYHEWETGADAMMPADHMYPFEEFDRIVFMGDYVDSFDISNVEILHNLKQIIDFKRAEPDRVVLLVGNHDVQYFVMHTICQGYRSAMRHDLYDLFMGNIDLFKFAHSETDARGRVHLWTHAGVTSGWYNLFVSKMTADDYRFRDDAMELAFDDNPEGLLNFAWDRRGDGRDVLFNVDADSGGISYWASPLWVRPERLNELAIRGINQIVGHTPVPEPTRHVRDEAGEPYWITYVDCLEYHDRAFIMEIDKA